MSLNYLGVKMGCIQLRRGCWIMAGVLLIMKLAEFFNSMITLVAIIYGFKKIYPNADTASTITELVFHWATFLIVVILLEGCRQEVPKRVMVFIISSLVAYMVYIPVCTYMWVKNGPGYTHQDWTIVGLKIWVIVWYMSTIIIAWKYYKQLAGKGKEEYKLFDVDVNLSE